jgi:uncharacterized protein (TIGR03000 family)
MYSVVLMAALTAGSAAPDCHRCGGCCGCYGGCWGGCYGGCWGGCYGGCWGGCYGGCYGGCGGCWGGGCGGCYGCWGGYSSWGCCGCVGGFGGGVSYPGGIIDGGAYAPGGVLPGAGMQGEQIPSAPTEDKDKDKKKKDTMLNSNKAKLVVELPANAKLFIDDMPMKAEPGVRSFNTPALQPGQAYYYMVRVETLRDGKPVSETRRVIVRAGQVARADFKELESDAIRTAQAK